MKLVFSLLIVAMLGAILPVQAATTDPLRLIYRISGVTDSGSAPNSGTATAFHCTNFSTVTERIRFLVRKDDGPVAGGRAVDVSPNVTVTAH